MKRLIVAMFPVLLVLSGVAHAADIVRVTSREASVYASPAGAGLDIRLHRGNEVNYLGARDGWLHVRLRNGIQGWMPGYSAVRAIAPAPPAPIPDPSAVKPTPEKPVFATVVSDEALIRSDPTNQLPAASDHTRLGMVPRGVTLRLIGRNGHWFLVELSRARHAWIYDETLALGATAPEKQTVLNGAALIPDKRRHTLMLFLDTRVPFRFFPGEHGVELHLYGAQINADMLVRPLAVGPFAAGTTGPRGLTEHEVNLTVALASAQYLRDMGADVVLTRTGRTDAMNDLYARTDLARNVDADLFVSIHANGGPAAAHGLEIYWFEDQSRPLAQTLAWAMEARIHTGPGKTPFASFAVIRQTQMPAALVEMGYMTNPDEGRMFHDPAFLDACAHGIADGIAFYLGGVNYRTHSAFPATAW